MIAALALLAATVVPHGAPHPVVRAIAADPATGVRPAATMEVLHIPTGKVAVNGVAYLPAGAGPHPILVILHGLPGNEKNLDLAQAARRAGWVAVTFNYRGSWGSPGDFSFRHALEDADAAVAYLRTPAVAARLHADPHRIVLAGHSMGGWATANAAAHDRGLLGAVLISAADIQRMSGMPEKDRVALSLDNRETLTASAQEMADQLAALPPATGYAALAPGLAATPLLVLTSDDGGAPEANALVAAVRASGGRRVSTRHVATDHGWSDARIRLETLVIDWIARLR